MVPSSGLLGGDAQVSFIQSSFFPLHILWIFLKHQHYYRPQRQLKITIICCPLDQKVRLKNIFYNFHILIQTFSHERVCHPRHRYSSEVEFSAKLHQALFPQRASVGYNRTMSRSSFHITQHLAYLGHCCDTRGKLYEEKLCPVAKNLYTEHVYYLI